MHNTGVALAGATPLLLSTMNTTMSGRCVTLTPPKATHRMAGRHPYRTDVYAKIFELTRTQPVATACRLLGVSRSGYYNWLNR